MKYQRKLDIQEVSQKENLLHISEECNIEMLEKKISFKNQANETHPKI